MSVTIEPLGGLGNQLFVYALGLRLARDLNTDLHCDVWNFYGYSWHSYELDTFENSITRTYSSRSREIWGHKARGLLRRARAVHLAPIRRSNLFLERSTTFDPETLHVRSGCRLNGYFQSWKYFEPISSEIRVQVSQSKSASNWLSESQKKLEQMGPWIAVHVRRGTYLEVPIMGIVQGDYYDRALHLLDNLIGELPIVMFSDSPELLGSISSSYQDRILPLPTPSDIQPIDVLQLMSDAAHLVIGNSTFSWWAAYIKDRPGRTVIAPRPWLDDQRFNERDLLLPGWITVGRE